MAIGMCYHDKTVNSLLKYTDSRWLGHGYLLIGYQQYIYHTDDSNQNGKEKGFKIS